MTLTNSATGLHAGQPIFTTGTPLADASAVMILVHGRGGNAADILSLADHLQAPGLAYVAPQAAQYTWYPQSFLAELNQNEPYLSSALDTIRTTVDQVLSLGIPTEKLILGGFSQGACLTSEFVARNANSYGGLLAFSGGLIGPPNTPREYEGRLDDMPIFLGCSNVDFHIPEARVRESADVFEKMGAQVNLQIYPNMGHTIIADEIVQAQLVVQAVVGDDQ
ncbi:MAG: dienelactone hydrolase family protein [Chloroflexota bacterium]